MVCLVMAETAARSMEHRLRTPSGGKQADGRDPWSSGKGLREHRGHVWCWDGPKGCSVQKNLMGGGRSTFPCSGQICSPRACLPPSVWGGAPGAQVRAAVPVSMGDGEQWSTPREGRGPCLYVEQLSEP